MVDGQTTGHPVDITPTNLESLYRLAGEWIMETPLSQADKAAIDRDPVAAMQRIVDAMGLPVKVGP